MERERERDVCDVAFHEVYQIERQEMKFRPPSLGNESITEHYSLCLLCSLSSYPISSTPISLLHCDLSPRRHLRLYHCLYADSVCTVYSMSRRLLHDVMLSAPGVLHLCQYVSMCVCLCSLSVHVNCTQRV